MDQNDINALAGQEHELSEYVESVSQEEESDLNMVWDDHEIESSLEDGSPTFPGSQGVLSYNTDKPYHAHNDKQSNVHTKAHSNAQNKLNQSYLLNKTCFKI